LVGGDEGQPATIENECADSFSRVVGCREQLDSEMC